MVPSTKITPISPCLLTAHHMVYLVGWNDVSKTFRGREPRVMLIHQPAKVEMDFIIKPQAV